jgi:hypothetical protein
MGLGRGALLWLLGIPLPIIILLILYWRYKYAEGASPLRPFACRFAIELTKIRSFLQIIFPLAYSPRAQYILMSPRGMMILGRWKISDECNGEFPLRWSMEGVGAARRCARLIYNTKSNCGIIPRSLEARPAEMSVKSASRRTPAHPATPHYLFA